MILPSLFLTPIGFVFGQRTLERYKALRRWQKLDKDFYDAKSDKFNISKLPDIYDSIVYDLRQSNPGAWLAEVSSAPS